MASLSEMIQLCRLCLVKDHVNIPIFDDPENVRQIPLKISSCLPVKISIDDNLPKKICDGCSNKLDLCYEFWNSTAHAEKTLLAMVEEKENQVPEAEMPQPFLLKVEAVESLEESQNQICEPPIPKPILVKDEEEAEDPPAKRPRRSAAIQAQMQIIPESDDEDDAAEGLATTKEVAEMDDDFEDPDVPDMIVDIDEVKPGPSGLNQTGVNSQFKLNMFDNALSFTAKNEPPLMRANYKCLTCQVAFYDLEEVKSHLHGCSCRDTCECCCLLLHANEHDVKNEPELKSEDISLMFEDFSEPDPCDSNEITQILWEHNYHSVPHLFKCKVCGKSFFTKAKLKKHLRVHTVKKSLICKECDKRFTTKSNLTKHLRVHTGEKPFKCKECAKGFSGQTSLKAHLRVHTGEKPYKCKECDKCFSGRTGLKAHLRSHTGEKPYKCPECNKYFVQKVSLNIHMVIHNLKKTHNCEKCGKRFISSGMLNGHILRDHGEGKPFNCLECGKSFSTKRGLDYHLRNHSGGKPFKCKDCDKCFLSKIKLISHLRVHIGENSLQCKECNKCFTNKTSLQLHLRIHTGEKPFKCKECSKCFTYKHTWKGHMLTHTGEKPLKCEICGKCFSYTSALHRHLLEHSSEVS